MRTTVAEIRSLAQQYTDGWIAADQDKILSTLSADCDIIESHGPRYRGTSQIKSWIEAWHAAGGKVLNWEIKSFKRFEKGACYEWNFSCRWEGKIDSFSGCTVVELKDSLITSMREYRRTHAPFEASTVTFAGSK
jgi:hypothetical protein